MSNLKRIAEKELLTFFSSFTAFIFLGAFLAVTLFTFFWVETFFARNIADVRPMFEWMPVLLIFLVPALTMRAWSEERKSQTLELLLTAPVSNLELTSGKFVAVMTLVLIALALTLPIPITVQLFLGQLDWGPVFGGYVALILLAASYTAIGLYISARTDNQIVSLLLSTFVCGLFFLIGSDAVTSLFSYDVSEFLKLLGSGSRFQSITRGVIDFRDLYYYLSITAVFLSLNVLELERLRWSDNRLSNRHRTWLLVTALCVLNFIALNFWLQQIGCLRIDLTERHIYSISEATRKYLSSLKEPLLMRGYFSKKTHPLLSPLVPRLSDLLKEYAIVGKGKVRVEFVDPLEKPELEKELAENYGVKPVVFQTASKHQAALTNSYFDILIKYGDQFEKLGFRDLIEVKAESERDIDVDLRNPEYDITNAIRKVLYSYQGTGNLFAGIEKPVTFVGYISPPDKLPQPLVKLKRLLNECLAELKGEANSELTIEFIDPDAGGGKVAKQLESDYGFRPMSIGLFDPKTFWFYLTLKCGDEIVQVPLPDEINKGTLERNIKSGLKRFSKGFLKTVGMCAPQASMSQFGMGRDGMTEFSLLKEKLGSSYSLISISLDKGTVPSDVDLLFLVSPEHLEEKELFAVDQFLMKGGTVMIARSSFQVSLDKAMSARKIESGLDKWLMHHGIEMQKTMVLDPQNFPLPIPVRRSVAGFTVEEMQLLPYPYFVDVRQDGMVSQDGIASAVNQVVMDWVSPVTIDTNKNMDRHVRRLLQSSPQSWTSSSTYIEPNFSEKQKLGFPVGEDRGRKLLAVAVEGSFQSFFKGKKPPSQDNSGKEFAGKDGAGSHSEENKQSVPSNIIDKSPDSARIILFGSDSFLSDKMLWLASESVRSRYLKPIELIENAIDWCLEDRELLSIRGRGNFARTLRPLDQGFQSFFEYLNYGLALVGLALVWFVRRHCRLKTQRRYQEFLQAIGRQEIQEEVRA